MADSKMGALPKLCITLQSYTAVTFTLYTRSTQNARPARTPQFRPSLRLSVIGSAHNDQSKCQTLIMCE